MFYSRLSQEFPNCVENSVCLSEPFYHARRIESVSTWVSMDYVYFSRSFIYALSHVIMLRVSYAYWSTELKVQIAMKVVTL